MWHLFQLCVDRLLDNQSPSLDTVKMQVYFDMNYTSRGETCKTLLLQNVLSELCFVIIIDFLTLESKMFLDNVQYY